jgi:hypothetical protein
MNEKNFTYEMYRFVTKQIEPFKSLTIYQKSNFENIKKRNLPLWIIFSKSNSINYPLISFAPDNNIIIPGKELKDIKSGTLCYLQLIKTGKIYKTIGEDVRDLQYWKYIFNQQLSEASQYLKNKTGIESSISISMASMDINIWSKFLDNCKSLILGKEVFDFYNLKKE